MQQRERQSGNIIKQHLEDCLGVQYRKTPLTSSQHEYDSLLNMQFNSGYSLVGRPGVKLFGQPGCFGHIFTYSYLDYKDGATKNEMLAINQNLWRMVEYSFVLTRNSGAPDWGWRVRFNTTSSTYKFQIEQGGVQVWEYDLGTGLETPGPGLVTTYNLYNAINAAAINFTASAFPPGQAVVNGTQSMTSGVDITLDVLAASNTLGITQQFDYFNHANYLRLVGWYLKNITTGNTRLVFDADIATSVVNQQVIGVGSSPAVGGLPIVDMTLNTASSKKVTFNEWRQIPSAINIHQASRSVFWSFHQSYYREILGDTKYPVSVEAAQQGCYILAPGGLTGSTASYPSGYAYEHEGYPYRYDGRFVHRAGLPQTTITAASIGGIGVSNNSRRFMAVPKLRDHRGVVIRGPASEPFTIAIPQVPNSGNATATINTIQHNTGFYTIGAKVNGALQPVPGTVNVDAGHSLQPGDVIYATRQGFGGGVGTQYTVTATTRTTLTLDGPSGLLIDNEWISPLTWELYSTAPNGAEFYLTAEMPNQADVSTQFLETSYTIPLGARYEDIELTYEPFPPPRAYCMTLHNGALVLGGSPEYPNSVFWSRPGAFPSSNLESFPPLNTTIIPSAVFGSIRTLISMDSQTLIVGKSSGLYALEGQIHNRNIAVDIISEGEWGIAGQQGIVRFNNQHVGVGYMGVADLEKILVKDAFNGVGSSIQPYLMKDKLLDYQMAKTVNDKVNGLAHFYVPYAGNGLGNLEIAGAGKYLVLDYERQNIWFERAYLQGMNPSAGIVVFNNEVYHCSGGQLTNGNPSQQYGCTWKHLNLTIDYAQNFIDHTYAIPYTIASSWIHVDTPAFEKQFHQLLFWWLYLVNETNQFVPCDYTLKLYRNYDNATLYSQTLFSHTSINQLQQVIDLYQEVKALAIKYSLNTEARFQSPRLSGFNLLVTEPYRHDNFIHS